LAVAIPTLAAVIVSAVLTGISQGRWAAVLSLIAAKNGNVAWNNGSDRTIEPLSPGRKFLRDGGPVVLVIGTIAVIPLLGL